MNELRWILIGFGIVLLAGIYLWGRRGRAAEPAMQPHGFTEVRREPAFQREDVSSYDEPAYEEDPSEDVVEEDTSPAVAEYEDTAVRPVRPASPRVEGRVARPEPLRPIAKEPPPAASVESPRPLPDFRRGRVEPTLGGDSVTEEIPVQSPSSTVTVAAASAPTLSSGEGTPQRRASDRRKILSLRLSFAPQRVEGAKLQEVLAAELLTHGKYEIFHRLHSDGQALFSVASMVEPGTFEPEKMGEILYPGVTMFAQLPGPVPGMHALNELVACARRLHQSLGGVLQDDRGVPLTVHRIERMKQEVRDFERPSGARGNQE